MIDDSGTGNVGTEELRGKIKQMQAAFYSSPPNGAWLEGCSMLVCWFRGRLRPISRASRRRLRELLMRRSEPSSCCR